MPKLGGRELASRVKAKYPDVHILYMSGYDPQRTASPEVVAASPAGRFLQKPFTIEELTAHVQAVLAKTS
jgi:DNA-binding response OmpR family regulator